MAFDGAGNFTRSHNFVSDKNNGIKIVASRMDTEFDNFATALNQTFLRSGAVALTGSLNMGTNTIFAVGSGTVGVPAVRFNADATSGLYMPAAGKVSLVAGGVARVEANSAGADITGALSISGNTTVGGTLAVAGASTLASVGVTANATVGGTLSVTGTALFGGNATIAGTLNIGNITAGGLINTTALQIAGAPVATQAYVAAFGYAPLASPTFTGVPAAPTAANGTSTTQLATCAFVQNQLAANGYAQLAGANFTGTMQINANGCKLLLGFTGGLNYLDGTTILRATPDGATIATFAAGGLTLATALSIANGGTGATTAAAARTNLGIDATGIATPGTIRMQAMTAIPTGWLECNGAAVSRTTYAALFAAIGTAYGVGNGSTTFNLPESRGEFVRGFDNGRGVDAGRVLGSYQAEQLGAHTHSYATPIATGSGYPGGTGGGFGGGYTTGSTGGAENRPRNFAPVFIIKT